MVIATREKHEHLAGLSLLIIIGLLVACAQQPAQIGGKYGAITSEERERIRQETEQRERVHSEQLAAARAERIKEQQRLAAEAQKQIEEDEALGYKHVPFADYMLDYKTMPIGTKRAIAGFYRVNGQLETLVENWFPDAPEIILLTETAPREIRKRLLECRRGYPCRMIVLGHTSRCEVTWLGRPVSNS